MPITIQDLPVHGGDIFWASQRYAIEPENWLDLSTGINPVAFPIPEIPEHCFQNLPYLQLGFLAAVKNYYGGHSALAVSGTQAAIQALPAIINADKNLPILIPEVGYQEHGLQWRKNAYTTTVYSSLNSRDQATAINCSLAENNNQHLLIINPNNPTSAKVGLQQLLKWASVLADGAYLIVDEAFIDEVPAESLLSVTSLASNIIILRSFGKFFGLAGIRLGFVFANDAVLKQLEDTIGIWQVNGPAQYIATQALNDNVWQQQARENLLKQSEKLRQVLAPVMAYSEKLSMQLQYEHQSSMALFQSVALPLTDALKIFDMLANQGVLTRVVVLSETEALLRVGSFSQEDQKIFLRLKSLFEQAAKVLV